MIKSLWNKTLFLSVIIECLALVASSAVADQTQTFSGKFPIDSYVDIPFTIDAHSEVKFEFDSLCDNSDNLKFFLRVAQRVNDFEPGYAIASGTGTTSPVDNIPLNKGGYIARLICGHVIKSPPDPEWTMTIISSPISISFAQDQEPAPEDPINLNSTMSFTGWLGLWGTPGLIHPTAPSSQGRDVWDYHFFNMKKDTKLKFKIEWDFKTGIDDPDIDFGVLFYKYIDGKIQFVHFFPALESSGDMTEEITLVEDAVYQVGFGGSAVGFNDDKKRYGGYKATVIIDGVPVSPKPAGLYLNFLSAEWEKSQDTALVYPYNLVIKYMVENTHNIAKTVRGSSSILAPGVKYYPDNARWDVETNDRADLMGYIAAMTLESGANCSSNTNGVWNNFCTVNRIPDDVYHDEWLEPHNCLYYTSQVYSPYYSIPRYSIKTQTISIPATLAEYRNFDRSIQYVVLGIQDKAVHPGTTGNDGCHVYGLYFIPVNGSIPAVNLLLNAD